MFLPHASMEGHLPGRVPSYAALCPHSDGMRACCLLMSLAHRSEAAHPRSRCHPCTFPGTHLTDRGVQAANDAADGGDMGALTQRSLIHWSKALCIRAALADSPEVSHQPTCVTPALIRPDPLTLLARSCMDPAISVNLCWAIDWSLGLRQLPGKLLLSSSTRLGSGPSGGAFRP